MGAERWVSFQKGELPNVRAILDGLHSISLGNNEVHIEWYGTRLEIGYSFGCEFGSELAAFVIREIATRCKVKRIGADSVGWYTGKPTVDKYGKSYDTWAEWAAEYDPKWSHQYITAVKFSDEYSDDMLKRLQSLSKRTAQFFKDRDKLLNKGTKV